MSSSDFHDLPSESACQCGMNNGLYCSLWCPSAMKANDNLMGGDYTVPPSSPDLAAMSDDLQDSCEMFCQKEIESERTFNQGRTDTPQLIDASISDIANNRGSAPPPQNPSSGDASYDSSESMDDSNVEEPEDEPANLLEMLAEKNECIRVLTEKLDACHETIEDRKDEAKASANELADAREFANQSLKTTNDLRNEIENHQDIIKSREEEIDDLQQSVATGDETIDSLRSQLANLSEVYTTHLARRGSLLHAAEEAREQSVREHKEAISKKEDSMRQLAEKLANVEATNQDTVDLCTSQRAFIDRYHVQIKDLREKLDAREQTITEQRKQIDVYSDGTNAIAERVESFVKDHNAQVESLERDIASRDAKIDSLDTESQHLARALLCEREVVDNQAQEIADLLQKTDSIVDDLASARLEREKEAQEALERLQVVMASKDELSERARLEREKDAKAAEARLDIVISSRAELLQKARDERERDAKRAMENFRVKDELLVQARREHEEEVKELQKKQGLLHKIISSNVEALSKARYDLAMTLREKDSLIHEKEQLHQAFTAAKKEHVSQAKEWSTRFSAQAKENASSVNKVNTELEGYRSQLSQAETIVSSLKATNTTLKATLQLRDQESWRAWEASQTEITRLNNRINGFKISWQALSERYARLLRHNNDLATDAEGWDRVASDDTFQIETISDDTIEFDNEDEKENDADVESLADQTEVEHIEDTEEGQEEELPTYEQSTNSDAYCCIVESETGDNTNYGSTVDLDEDDLELGEEDDDWVDMSE